MIRMWRASVWLLAVGFASSSLVAQSASPASQAPASAPAPVEPPGFAYNAEGRRDPFVSLLRRGTGTRGGTVGARPAGLAGLEVAEVTLTVTDSAGIQGTSSQNITIINGVTSSFTYSNPTNGSLAVVFNAEESGGSNNGFGGKSPITKYIWHFGDSADLEEATSPIVSHTFPAAAVYTVTLTVEDSAGRRQTSNQSIAVAN